MIDPTKGLGEPGLLVMVNGSQFLVATKYQVLLALVLGFLPKTIVFIGMWSHLMRKRVL